ncbi:D-lactate dehydrogenase [Companilactobacillus paralimentarius DSM 13238 = JCM 10415]|uniref:D-lactate dehydrogenase n=1 Tax=Companilactobacillus paralimentarius DSM 13238 = JCM 10415 TaxID=1122151 RepID=A0A0R1PMY6_9LACO|nr:D-2-hydroxyacid dehydrogenase [Companilactobacillus paralimentarius]KAE9564374.1 lactate dehydrogenase [Companilactobacillus paralimentarius]KRL31285.1 D-lactate dehydrogenase [Companilactobacillus paralimentarius DSM 13238 = JCM 10415]QFR69501.1 lactate dehydrogenase [Companilactobacillus paralimentarius]
MKIFAYGIREDEEPSLRKWEEANPNIEVGFTKYTLTADSARLAEGSDGVVTLQTSPYTRKALEVLNKLGIKYISIRNVGFDNFNFKDLNDLGFTLTNVPVYSPNAIAEHTVLLMGRLLRRVPEFDEKFDNGDFTWAPTIGKEYREQTVGVVGTGHIGRVVIKILQGFGAKVVAYDVYHNDDIEKQGLYVDSLEELYKQSDIITLHVPLFDSNKYMINDKAISQMKDGVYIINCARGELIDTDALIKGLDSGKVAGAGLDVLDNENSVFGKVWSSIDNIPNEKIKNLAKRTNVIITPHSAFYTETAIHNMITTSFDSNKALIEGLKPNNIVDTTK